MTGNVSNVIKTENFAMLTVADNTAVNGNFTWPAKIQRT
jgi:hypothetical protein